VDEQSRGEVSAELFGALARIVHRTAMDAAAVLREEGLNPAQFQLLQALGRSPGVTQAALVQQRGVTPGGISQLLGKLEALGAVRREADGAANRVWLTDHGRELVERLTPDQDSFFVRRFAGLSPAELGRLRDLAVKALDQLPAED
jgi:DNA-binding MarR family transcriptional regulator